MQDGDKTFEQMRDALLDIMLSALSDIRNGLPNIAAEKMKGAKEWLAMMLLVFPKDTKDMLEAIRLKLQSH